MGSMTFACHNCGGTGYIYNGSGSTLDEDNYDNYDNCPHCDGYGYFEEILNENDAYADPK